MTSGANFWDAEVWSFVVTITILLVGMMLANILRKMIPFLRRSLIPSSVLGGFLILFADFIFKRATGSDMFRTATLEALTYHGLGLGFIAMTLVNNTRHKSKSGQKDIFNTSITVVATYLQQAVVGLGITLALYYILGSFFASGLILPLGYGQGPGQAYTWGRTYENTYGFVNGTSFGLTVAAMGFISASVGGVIYLNILRRKGRFHGDTGRDVEDEDLSAEMITGKNEIPLSESMDKLTVQLALVFIAYIGAYALMLSVNALAESGLIGGLGRTLQSLAWGFNFLFGVLTAVLLKMAMKFCKKKGWMKKEYTNNFMQTRIAGFFFDMMVVASIAAIDLSAFHYKEFVIPLVCICLSGGVVTYFQLEHIAKRLFPGYRDEFWLSMYGMLTGTVSTGIILLRETDQTFETPAAMNLIYQNLWSIVFGFPMLLLLAVAPQSVGHSWFTFGVLCVLLAAMYVILFRESIFKRKKG